MISARWIKVLKDLWSNKARSTLAVLSIAVGVFSVGLVSNAYVTMLNDLAADYRSVNPHTAILYTDPFGEDALISARKVPGVINAEGRNEFSAQVQTANGDWKPAMITSIPPLEDIQIDLIRPVVDGEKLILGKHQVLLERTGLGVLPVKEGDTIRLLFSNDQVKELQVAGVVHEVTAYATPLSGRVNLYVSPETMLWLGDTDQFTMMLLTTAGNQQDEKYVNQVASRVATKLEKGGLRVYLTAVYRPGEHPAYSILRTLLVLLGFLGVLALLLSTFLVVNTVTALMAQQIRQIGVMKAIGGQSGQLLVMYVLLIVCFGLLALFLAIPLAGLANYGLMGMLSNMINFKTGPFRIPLPSFILQILVGLALPLVAAFVPVRSGTRMTIREAIGNQGLNASGFRLSWFDRMLEQTRLLPRPFLLSLRNTFRRKGRMALTLATLTLGGAIFIAVFNVRSSFIQTINDVLGYFLSDVNVSLGDLYRVNRIENIITSISGVKSVESWGVRNAQVLSPDQKSSTEVIIWGPPENSKLIRPVIVEGRWIRPGDMNALVIGNHFLEKRPGVKIGDELVVRISEKDYPFVVVGIFQMAGNVYPPFVYTSYEALSWMTGRIERSSEYRVITTLPDPGLEKRIADEMEKEFKQNGIRVGGISTGAEQQAQQKTSIDILVYCLLVMALLIALVGGIGLMGTMGMNVMERTREIGVIRSYGASNLAVLSMVVVEGMTIGIISWLLGVLLAFPISMLLCNAVGVAFVHYPLPLIISKDGFVLWLVVSMALSGLASLLPAFNAVRLTVRDVLAYE